MSRRPIFLALVIATSSVAACSDSTSVTQPLSARPSVKASQDLIDPGTCRTGYNPSTGRCY